VTGGDEESADLVVTYKKSMVDIASTAKSGWLTKTVLLKRVSLMTTSFTQDLDCQISEIILARE
jgi:hypothetical protein